MACKICSSFTNKQLARIQRAYEDGNTPEDISAQFSAPLDDMIDHCKGCIKDDETESKAASLKELLDGLRSLISHSKDAYESDTKRSDVLQAHVSLIREIRETLEQMDNAKSPEENIRSIINVGINPLVKKAITSMATELNKMKSELVAGGMKESLVDSLNKRAISGFGQDLSSSIGEIIEKLGKHYGLSKKETSKLAIFGSRKEKRESVH